jgi:hypothetical protein
MNSGVVTTSGGGCFDREVVMCCISSVDCFSEGGVFFLAMSSFTFLSLSLYCS